MLKFFIFSCFVLYVSARSPPAPMMRCKLCISLGDSDTCLGDEPQAVHECYGVCTTIHTVAEGIALTIRGCAETSEFKSSFEIDFEACYNFLDRHVWLSMTTEPFPKDGDVSVLVGSFCDTNMCNAHEDNCNGDNKARGLEEFLAEKAAFPGWDKQCPEDMDWTECGTDCPASCWDLAPICTQQCVPSCQCKPGTVILPYHIYPPICGLPSVCPFTAQQKKTLTGRSSKAERSLVTCSLCSLEMEGIGCLEEAEDSTITCDGYCTAMHMESQGFGFNIRTCSEASEFKASVSFDDEDCYDLADPEVWQTLTDEAFPAELSDPAIDVIEAQFCSEDFCNSGTVCGGKKARSLPLFGFNHHKLVARTLSKSKKSSMVEKVRQALHSMK